MGPATVKKSRSAFRLPRALGSVFLAGCLLSSSLGMTGCGAARQPTGTLDPSTGKPTTYQLVAPTLKSIAPNEVALGDTVKVFGKDFIDKAHGTLSLYMEGTFTSDSGSETRYKGTIPLTYVGPGQATFEFGPKVFFSNSGKELGTFNGVFNVVNKLTGIAANAEAGKDEPSEGQKLSITAKPSIYFNQMRSVDGDCPLVTTGTTPGNNMAFGLEVLGMDDARESDPITFSYSFQSPNLTAGYVENSPYNFPPYTGDGAPTPPMETTGSTQFSYDIKSGNSTTLDPQNVELVVNVNPPVTVSQTAQNQSQVKLARLFTGKQDSMTAPSGTNFFNMTVQATRGDGTTIIRTLNVPIHAPLEVGAATAEVLGGRESAQVLTGCVGGGQFGQEYQYTKGSSITRQRSINLTWNTQFNKNWNANANANLNFGLNLGIGSFGQPSVNLPKGNNNGTNGEGTGTGTGTGTGGAGPGQPGGNTGGNTGGGGGGGVNIGVSGGVGGAWTQTFGVDVSDSVSAEEHKGETFSIHILPAFSLVLYGQFFWLQRSAPLLLHTACGEALEAGTATLNNPKWHFDPEQATSTSCDPPNSPATILGEAMGYTPAGSGN